ncbi:hypothetical protein [Rhodopseudomonas telluris]|uniref:Uncharacterized protein n=1 Tax=Rhodopseudomonas telluris TaxID=644215 RepID=A0ABV6ENX7_9BRAD
MADLDCSLTGKTAAAAAAKFHREDSDRDVPILAVDQWGAGGYQSQ